MTLRRFLLLAVAGLTAIALLLVSGTAAYAMHDYLLGKTDSELTQTAKTIGFRQERAGETVPPVAVLVAPGYVIELRDKTGTTIYSAVGPQIRTVPLLDHARLDDSRPQNVAGFRVLVIQDPEGTYVLIGQSLGPIDSVVTRFLWIAGLTSLVVLALLALVARAVLIRRLRPLNEIAAAATDLAGGQLDRRVPSAPGGARTEVGRLTSAINGMLARIQAALSASERSERRMREFVADASHELRTPVTSIRGYLQMVITGVIDLRERPDVLGRMEQEAARMGGLVDSLLYLARLDAGPPARREPVDLAAVVRAAVADAAAVAPDRPLTADLPAECPITGDADGLHQVVANLLGNVRQHTPPGTAAHVSLTAAADRVRVAVTDDGPGMDAEAAAHAFDRFWRAPSARSGTGGAGLGLAIVAEVVRDQGGEVGIEGCTVWFEIPRVVRESPDPAHPVT